MTPPTTPATAVPPGTLERANEHWERLRAILDERQLATADVLAGPVLMRRDVVAALLADGLVGDEKDTIVAAALAQIHEQLDEVRSDLNYPLGAGPVEFIWHQLESSALTFEAAAAAVVSLPVTEGLTPMYAEALLRRCREGAGEVPGDVTVWRRTRRRAELVMAAVASGPFVDDPRMTEAVDLGWVKCAHLLLCAVPDRRMFEDAVASGRRLLERVADDPAELAYRNALFAALWSDPYTNDRISHSWQAGHQLWERRGYTELTTRDGRSYEDWVMPPIEEALATAIEHWRAAYPVLPSLTVVTGWSQAEHFLAQVRRSEVPSDVGRAVARAIVESEGQSEGSVGGDVDLWMRRSQLLASATSMNVRLQDPGTAGLESADLDYVAARLGRRSPRVAVNYAAALADYDPAACLAILEHFSSVFADPELTSYQDLTAGAFAYAHRNFETYVAKELPARPEDQTFEDYASAYLNEAQTPFLIASRALRLACQSINHDAEALGISLVAVARDEAPLFATRIEPQIKALAALLHTNEASNRVRAGDLPGAVRMYVRAMQLWMELGRQEPVADLFARIIDVTAESDQDTAIELAARLSGIAPDLLRIAGSYTDAWLAQALGRVLGSLLRNESINIVVLWFVLQLRAGLRTALVLGNPTAPRIDSDEECRLLLTRLRELPDQFSDPRAASIRGVVQERYRAKCLEGAIEPPMLELEHVRRVIDDSTVLLVTATASNNTDRGRLAMLAWDDGEVVAWDGWTPWNEEMGLMAPGMIYELEQLAAKGKRHLCIFTDEGLQTFPWHQLTIAEGTLLGDRWLVTLLPHPNVLMRGRRGGWVPRTPTYPVVAFGVRSAGPDWEPLEDAVEEASSIAAALGGIAVLDADATEATFRALSEQCRYLHVATHGVFHSDHPAFHSVMLSAGDEDDGILHAYEVATLDLSAVELVTLSACETAQLTVSDGDSVDGLPVAFLAAGARAVIGTQVEVETAESRFFFEALYQGLAQDPDLRAAFVAARDSTRARFPDSDAWGSFYLLGGWS